MLDFLAQSRKPIESSNSIANAIISVLRSQRQPELHSEILLQKGREGVQGRGKVGKDPDLRIKLNPPPPPFQD